MNWRLKILAKMILHHLPVDYRFWQRLGLFRLGAMDEIAYAEKIFNLHASRTFTDGVPVNATLLELGPGDSALSAILAQAAKAKKIYLVDTGDYVNRNITIYRELTDKLRKQNKNCIDAHSVDNVEALLRACHAEYLTEGLNSLQQLRGNSVDFIWSHSVLEHIRKAEFAHLFNEMLRILKPGALMSHNVDFMDHLGGALNNLRFSEKVWELDFVANSGFYTNRIRYSEMESLMQQLGFAIADCGYSSWTDLPTARQSMAEPFRTWPEPDLKIRCCHFLASKPGAVAINSEPVLESH